MIKNFDNFIKESSSKNIDHVLDTFNGVDFGIDYELLMMLLVDITDEYDMYVGVGSSYCSSLVEGDGKSFCITIDEGGSGEFGTSVDYLEPQIFEWIVTLNSRLSLLVWYVSDSDFGSSDAEYEIIVSFLGHTPTPYSKIGDHVV